jgi:Repeat of unknown function (DUF5648)
MANKYIQQSVNKFTWAAKQLFLIGGLALLASFGSSSSEANLTVAEVRAKQVAALDETRVGLMESLAKLYPNGKLPVDQQIAASKLLMQNPSVFRSNATASNTKAQLFAGVAADFSPVYRIQNTTLYGSYFFTIYDSEKASALSLNPDWKLEGPAFYASPTAATDLSPVYRFRNKVNGSYVFSIYEAERNSINTSYADTFAEEGVAWYARQTPAEGFTELYRFRNKTNGTYLFTAYASEKQAIIDNYPEIFVYEGVAYYVQVTAAGAAYTGTVIDGYIRGATVFWDCNDNLKLDPDEIKTTSGLSGRYLIGDMPNVACILRAIVPSTAIDEDTNSAIGVPMVLSSISGKPQLISPLTTPVGIGAMTEIDVLALLNGSTLSLTDDYIAAGSAGVQNHNAARYVAATLKAISGQINTDNKEVRGALLSKAMSQLPQSAWTTKTPLAQVTFENYFTDNWGLGLIDPFAPFLTKQSFMLDLDGILALQPSQRVAAQATVQKALDAVNSRPDTVAGGVIVWGALPQSVRSTFAPTLAITDIFPETSDVAQLRAVLIAEGLKTQVEMKAAKNESIYKQRAKLLESITTASVTSLSTAVTVFAPATTKIIKNTKVIQKYSLLKEKIEALKKLKKFLDVSNSYADCGSFFLTMPSTLADLEGNLNSLVEDLVPWGLDGLKCVNSLAGSEKIKFALDAASGVAGTVDFADAKEYVKFQSALNDITLAILDMASLDIPRAILAEWDLIVIKRVTMAIEQNETADKADAEMQKVFEDAYARFKLFADDMGDKILSARLKPYIRPFATACKDGYFLSNGRCLENPTVTNITPTAATLNTATVFTVTGTNLPLTAILDVAGATCQNPGSYIVVGIVATGFSQTCTSTTTGVKTITVKTAPGGTKIDDSRTVNVSAAPAPTGVFNIATDFSIATNPNGAWSYGYKASSGSPFQLFNTPTVNAFGVVGFDRWNTPSVGAEPHVMFNKTNTDLNYVTFTVPAKTLQLHPGSNGEIAVARWTAPSSGTYQLNAIFRANDNTTTLVNILKNGVNLFNNSISGTGMIASYNAPISIVANDTLDFLVDRNLEYHFDSTGLAVSITPVIAGGTFNVPANSSSGTPFTVPAGTTNCTFNASGTWMYSSGLAVSAEGDASYTNNPSYPRLLGTVPYFALIAGTSNGYIAIGSSRTLAVSAGSTLNLQINEGAGAGNSYADNSGALSVSYSCN